MGGLQRSESSTMGMSMGPPTRRAAAFGYTPTVPAVV